jgi:hypothetical protein
LAAGFIPTRFSSTVAAELKVVPHRLVYTTSDLKPTVPYAVSEMSRVFNLLIWRGNESSKGADRMTDQQ